jgi:hypothetical protein
MNSIPSELVSPEEHTDVVHETEDGLVEVGAVTQTKGGVYGPKMDSGLGLQFL